MRGAALPMTLLLAAVACGDGAPDEPSAGSAAGDPKPASVPLGELRGEWVLTHFAEDDPAPEDPPITLSFTEQGVAGSSGCNRYFGSPQSGDAPSDLSFGPLGGTRMACPPPAMDLEQRYLTALGSVRSFDLREGNLALTYADGVLLFKPLPRAEG